MSEDVVGKIAPTAQARSSDVQENLSPIVGNGIPSSNGMADVAVISMKPNYIYQDSLQPISTSCLQQSEETKSEKKQGNSEVLFSYQTFLLLKNLILMSLIFLLICSG